MGDSMDELEIKKLNLKALNFLRDYESKNITFNDISSIFTYDELLVVLESSSWDIPFVELLQNVDLPEDFQEFVDTAFVPKLHLGFYHPYMKIISDNAILEQSPNLKWLHLNHFGKLFKSDEARIKALSLRTIKKDSYKVREIIESFDNDNLKIKYLHLVDKASYRQIFSTLKDERIQTEIIEKYPNESGQLIANLENEDIRIYYYERHLKKLDSENKKIIFNSLTEENKEKYLDRYWKYLSDDERAHHLSCVENENFIMQRINMISSDFSKVILIDELKSKNPHFIPEIASTIKYDKSKRLLKKMVQESLLDIVPYLNSKELLANTSDNEKIQLIKNEISDDKISLILLSCMKDIKNIEKIINHYDNLPEYDTQYDEFIVKYAENYNLNPDHLIKTTQIFGLEILKNIKLDKLQKIINLDDVSFNKTMELFTPDKYKMDNATLNDNINIFLQRKFRIENPQIINISSEIRTGIQNGQKDAVLSSINTIISEYDINNVLSKYNYTREQFITELLENGERDEKITNCLLEITNGYIVYKRNEFIRNNVTGYYQQFTSDDLDPKDALKFVIQNYPVSIIRDVFFDPKYITEKRGYSKLEQEFVNHPSALDEIIDFRCDPSKYTTMPENAKKYMPIFNRIFEDRFKNRSYELNLDWVDEDIKRIYSPIQLVSPNELREALMVLDVDALTNGILNDSNSYEVLSDTLHKYKLFGFEENMRGEFFSVGIDAKGYNIGYLINYFPTIYKELNEKLEKGEIKNITLPAILDMAGCYAMESDKLSTLFGKENTRFLASNPGPNASPMDKEPRLEKAQAYLKVMNDRTTVSVPSYDQDFELSNGKKINVVVGNVSDPINLTYGERTGACMRIGGHADSLFDFCLTDENGFHVRFSNPENDNFVSRVSGFRNGNTVFLNELRYSKDSNYTNDDVKESCTLAAQALIELSKNSSNPIENVVIAPQYVMENEKTVLLGVSNIKKGVGNFYTDVGRSAVIMATSNPDNSLIPVKLGNNSSMRYPVQRGKIKMYTGEEINTHLSRIEMLDQVLSGVKIEDTQITPKENIEFAYCGEDWYVTVNSQGEINKYVMKNSNKKDQAMIEQNTCINHIQNQLEFVTNANISEQVKNEGGVRK